MSRPELQRLQRSNAASIPIFPHPPPNLISREATWHCARPELPRPYLVTSQPRCPSPPLIFPRDAKQPGSARPELLYLQLTVLQPRPPISTRPISPSLFHAKQPGTVLGQNFHARTSLSHSPMPIFTQPFPVMRSNLVVLGQYFRTSNSPCYTLDPHLLPTSLPLPILCEATW